MHNTKYSLFTLCVLSLALTACDNKQSANNTNPISTQKAEKQEIIINNAAEPSSLDPHKAGGVPESNAIRQILVGLTTSDPNGKTIGGMAETWESSDDNKIWTFHLRDAKWSNGDPVTAQDFVYSFRRLVNPDTASPRASYLAEAKILNAQEIINGKAKVDSLGIKALDNKTVQITLNDPVPYLPDMLIQTSTFAVNQKAIEQYGDKWTSPEHFVSNGPYKLKKWVVNEKIVLERNPNYFDNAHVSINQVTLLPIASTVTDINGFKSGEIDVSNSDIPTEQFASIKKEMGNQIHSGPVLCTYYYELNNSIAPFNDVRVRKALSLAFDRDFFTSKIVGRGEKPAYQLTPTFTHGMNNFEPEWKTWGMSKRIAEAKKLLAEAGYSATNPLKFELLYNTNENHKRLATAAAALWKENLGIVNITLNNQEWKNYLETRRSHKHQMARASWCADYNEPSNFLNILKSNGSINYGLYQSTKFNDLMHQTLQAGVNAEQRAKLYQQAEAQLDQDTPDIFAYYYQNNRLVKPYVQGYSAENPLDTFQVKDWSILKHE